MMTPDDLACGLISFFVLVIAFLFHPTHASCPPSWRQSGINTVDEPNYRRGVFHCEYFPYQETDVMHDFPGKIYGRLYCAATQTPIQIDDRTVACRNNR